MPNRSRSHQHYAGEESAVCLQSKERNKQDYCNSIHFPGLWQIVQLCLVSEAARRQTLQRQAFPVQILPEDIQVPVQSLSGNSTSSMQLDYHFANFSTNVPIGKRLWDRRGRILKFEIEVQIYLNLADAEARIF